MQWEIPWLCCSVRTSYLVRDLAWLTFYLAARFVSAQAESSRQGNNQIKSKQNWLGAQHCNAMIYILSSKNQKKGSVFAYAWPRRICSTMYTHERAESRERREVWNLGYSSSFENKRAMAMAPFSSGDKDNSSLPSISVHYTAPIIYPYELTTSVVKRVKLSWSNHPPILNLSYVDLHGFTTS